MKMNTLSKARFLLFLCILLTITISVSLAIADNGDDIVNTAGKYDGQSQPAPHYGEQCKGFVKDVYMEALGVELPTTNGNNADWNSYEQYGFRLVSDFSPERVFQNRDSSVYTKEYFFKEFVFTLSKGDAIQIDGDLPHTMIYVSTNTSNGQPSGFRVIESNWNFDYMVHFRDVSFDDLWNYMGGASSNGMRAYRYTGK